MKNYELRNDIFNKVIKELIKSKTIKKLCKEYGQDVDYINHIPICFADLDVSARTEHGIIYINKKFIDSPQEIPAYCAHEMTHHFQQCFSDGPTKSLANDYLSDPNEIEGFQNQNEYISEHEGKEEAEKYVEQVLEHHDVPENKKNKKKKELLKDASKQLRLDFSLPKENEKNIESRKDKLDRFKKILEAIEDNKNDFKNDQKYLKRPGGKLQEKHEFRMKQLGKFLRKNFQELDDTNNAKDKPYNKENDAEHRDSKDDPLRKNKNQLRFKFRNISQFSFEVRQATSLTSAEIEELRQLTLGGEESEMNFFLKFDIEKLKLIDLKINLTPHVILCTDKNTTEIVGWLLAKPIINPKSENDPESKKIEVDIFVDRYYRDNYIGKELLNRLHQLQGNLWPDFKILVQPWSRVAHSFYSSEGMDFGDFEEDQEEKNDKDDKIENNQLKLFDSHAASDKSLKKQLLKIFPKIAEGAQEIVDAWEQDEEGYDEEFGIGGICDAVADKIWQVVQNELDDITIIEGGHDGDEHAYIIVYNDKEAYIVDIDPDIYEVGAGYSYRKIRNAKIKASDVLIEELPRNIIQDEDENNSDDPNEILSYLGIHNNEKSLNIDNNNFYCHYCGLGRDIREYKNNRNNLVHKICKKCFEYLESNNVPCRQCYHAPSDHINAGDPGDENCITQVDKGYRTAPGICGCDLYIPMEQWQWSKYMSFLSKK